MITVETIGRVRHDFHVKGKKIKQISRELRLARNTVRTIVRGVTVMAEHRVVGAEGHGRYLPRQLHAGA